MDSERLQRHRRERLKDLRDQRFEGENVSLGRALGHASGAFVRQMLDGERPITEKTIAKVEMLRGCSGWFSVPVELDLDSTWPAEAGGNQRPLTAGAALLAVARAMGEIDAFKRKAIASIVTDMLVNGERESAASAIDAMATVVVSLPSSLGDVRSKFPPERANDDDQNHNLVETVSSKSNESITVIAAPSQVTGTQPGADEETGKPWKELGTLVGGTGPDRRKSKEWTPSEKPKPGRGRKT